jgi:DNA helicase-2/ATP-dependent DNA helicase PcrA
VSGPVLTPEQQVAVEAPDGAYYVLAPPGSGKTEVLVRRALWLVEQAPEDAFRVLAITYTNKGAEELRERASVRLGEDAWRITATTFHAFCLDMLQRYGELVGVTGEVGVYDSDELRLEVLADALRTAGALPEDVDEATLSALLHQIDELRLDLQPPELAPDTLVLDGEITLADAYQLYEQALTDSRMVDFNAMLLRGHRLLVEDPWVGEHYRRQYRHLLVDEAQDLNRAQLEILRALRADDLRSVFIVADHDQELFGFSGASAEYAAEFAEEIGARKLPLTSNFRCARSIVRAAEQLRTHIRTLKVARPPAVSTVAAPGWIGARSYRDVEAEAAGVADWVNELLTVGLPDAWLHEGEDADLAPDDVCVLSRTRFGFDALAAAFAQLEIPYLLRTEEGGLFDSVAGRVVYLALRVYANPHDGASRRRLSGLLGKERAPAVASVPAVEYDDGRNDGLPALQRSGLPREFLDAFAEAASGRADTDTLVQRLASLPPSAGRLLDEEREADLWVADQERLAEQWQSFALLTRVDERSLVAFLRQMSRVQRTTVDAPGVRFLTPYRAKGLQFRAVVLIRMNEGTFPHYRSSSEREIDEERRAVYVAVTRAARGVLLTRPDRRVDRYRRVYRDEPSRFLAELGLDLDES